MMNSPRTGIKCGVGNCHYNKSMSCHADNIEVNAMGDGHAETSDGTCCTTFKDKDKGGCGCK